MSQYQAPPGIIPIDEVLPSDVLPPPDFYLKESWAYAAYFDVQPGEVVDLTTTGFTSYTIIGQNMAESALQDLAFLLAEQGQELLAWAIYEKPTFDISVPNEICILDWCFTPPFAGDSIASGYDYYMFFITRPKVQAAFSVRPLLPAVIAAVVGFVILTFSIVMLWKWSTGQITLKQLTGAIQEVFKAPGKGLGEVTQGITTPLVVGGIFMGIAAIAFPLVTNIGIKAPIGPATIEAGAGTAPAPRRTR